MTTPHPATVAPAAPDDYELLDSGQQRKLERFGPVVLSRPCAQAVWEPALPSDAWARADASFDREEGHRWTGRHALPDPWILEICGFRLRLSGTDFGHLGVFPEQRPLWAWIRNMLTDGSATGRPRVLNLFAYSGGATLAAALAGAEVCHLDASRGMVDWARANAELNGLSVHPIRWIVDDVNKFLQREVRRDRQYDAILLDPPSFGRGREGELYKIERDLPETLDLCVRLLSDSPRFLLLSAHTPGFTPIALENLLKQALPRRDRGFEKGEMLLSGGPDVLPVPSGAFARWASDPLPSTPHLPHSP
jgi:23S rRNA (cytosine1962-C5)-methyltransferase